MEEWRAGGKDISMQNIQCFNSGPVPCPRNPEQEGIENRQSYSGRLRDPGVDYDLNLVCLKNLIDQGLVR